MNILLIGLMLVLCVLAVLMLKAKNSAAAAGCAVLVGLLAVVHMLDPWGVPAGIKYAKKNQEVMAYGVAQKIAKRYNNPKVVVLAPPQRPELKKDTYGIVPFEQLLPKALRKNFDIDAELLTFSKQHMISDMDGRRVQEVEELSELEVLLADADSLSAMLSTLDEQIDVVVITSPFSVDGEDVTLPLKGEGPHLILTSLAGGDLKEALENSILDVVLKFHFNTSALKKKPWPKNKAEAFNQRFYFESADGTGPEQISLNF